MICRSLFHISEGSILSFLQIKITVSNDAPPTPLESKVINELYGMSASTAICLNLYSKGINLSSADEIMN